MILLKTMSTSEILSWGAKSLVVGLGSVFFILILLVIVTRLLKIFSVRESKKIASATANEAIERAEKEKSVAIHDSNDDEIIAVIAAAISCISENEGRKYAIKSYRRVGTRTRVSY